MGLYREQILPRFIDRTCGTAELAEWRERVAAGLSGTIVEIGFGSGLNMLAYPRDVTLVYAVEPSQVARRLAQPRIDESQIAVEHVGLDGEALSLDNDSCDGALATFTLCTIPNVEAALGELLRVLRPAGQLHFLEHGRAPEPKTYRWQRRIEPIHKRLADGCHLTRNPADLVQAAGFEIIRVESRYASGPKPWSWFTEGIARKPG